MNVSNLISIKNDFILKEREITNRIVIKKQQLVKELKELDIQEHKETLEIVKSTLEKLHIFYMKEVNSVADYNDFAPIKQWYIQLRQDLEKAIKEL